VLHEYVEGTSDTLSANLLFLKFNLHAAAPFDALSEPAPTPKEVDLPSSTELVGTKFQDTVSPFVYQPSEILSERGNLKDSWYTVSASEQPAAGYFTTEFLNGNVESTTDGWPTEYYSELKRLNRFLLFWGSVDIQMQGYNFADDNNILFPQNYLSSNRDVQGGETGDLESGCFFDAELLDVSRTNSSWAVSTLNESILDGGSSARLWNLTNNLASCGISPILNFALSNTTVDMDVAPYIEFVRSAIWNWAAGEPRQSPNSERRIEADSIKESPFRCAVMETAEESTRYRWRVEYCGMKYRAACRFRDRPFGWKLSDDSVTFDVAALACPENYSFSVPRTGLENKYLYEHIRSLPGSSPGQQSGHGSGVWLNYNSLDMEDCWVSTGPNGTCPYLTDQDSLRQRTILVPTIAALVVLILTALTLFVKCNTNRRNSRRRVRGAGGWDYEGVPS
jgi:hypothetical protein